MQADANGTQKPDWLAIRKQYETSAIGLRQLARVVGCSPSTIMKRSMREGWKQNARLVRQTANKLEAAIEERATQRIQNELLPWIEEQKVRFTKRGFKVANTGLKRVETMFKSMTKPSPKSEAFISKAAETYHRIGRVALGMGDGSQVAGAVNLNILTSRSAIQVVNGDQAPI